MAADLSFHANHPLPGERSWEILRVLVVGRLWHEISPDLRAVLRELRETRCEYFDMNGDNPLRATRNLETAETGMFKSKDLQQQKMLQID
jgi:hypothetical protein